MAVSDLIASFILEALEDSDGSAELQRSVLADKFNCVPSQINYVISTRFSPERGYVVESRRGGGGYIRISRVQLTDPRSVIMHTINSVGGSLDLRTAAAFLSNAVHQGVLAERDARLILAGIGDNALHSLPREIRDTVRSSIFKYMLLQTVND